MKNQQLPPRRVYGDLIFDGFINPSDLERPDQFKNTGRIAVFFKEKEGKKRFFRSEKHILNHLAVFEMLADSGVYEGRSIEKLFNAVKVGLPVTNAMCQNQFKPQDLFMFLDGMYAGEVRPVTPFVDRPPPRYREPN